MSPAASFRDSRLVVLLTQSNDCEPQVIGHPAVTVILCLPDAGRVGSPRLLLAPEVGEHVAQARIGVTLVVFMGGHVALESRCLIFVTLSLLVFVRQGEQAGRVVR